MSGIHVISSAVLTVAFVVSQGDAVVVDVDRSATYQTIDGVGITTVLPHWQAGNYYLPDEPFWPPFADTLVREIGISLVRGFDTRACDFNPSPGTFVVTPSIRSELRRFQTLKRIADSLGQTFRFAPDVFSPPGWMKANGRCEGLSGDNSLLAEHYDDFGRLCAAFIAMAQDTFGLPVYAFSPQNEPDFDVYYASCVYEDGAHYAQMLRVVGPHIKAVDPAILIYGVEGVASVFPSWEGALTLDTVAVRYIDRFASHIWGISVRAQPATFSDPYGTRARPVWASEANWENSWNAAEAGDYSFQLLRMFAVGRISALLIGGDYWNPVTGSKATGFWIAGQFARFIRPGMKGLGVTSSDDAVMAAAFGSPSGPLTIVLANRGAEPSDVTLSASGGALPPQFTEVRRTGGGEGYRDLGPMASTATFTVPGYGMLSMGYGHRDVETSTVRRRQDAARAAGRPTQDRLSASFDLRGRVVRVTGTCRMPAACVVQGEGGNTLRLFTGTTCH